MPQLLTNASTTGPGTAAQWGGGPGQFEVSATTFNAGTVTLQALQQNGSYTDVTGTALTANGRVQFQLPPCSIRANATTAPGGMNAAAWRIRGL